MQLPLVELQLRPTNKFDECSRSGKLLPMNKCDQGDLAGSGAIDAICIRKSAKERWGGRGEVEREREPRVEGGGGRVELICMARANSISKLGGGGWEGGSGREGIV
jgi:hypothetical protein